MVSFVVCVDVGVYPSSNFLPPKILRLQIVRHNFIFYHSGSRRLLLWKRMPSITIVEKR